MGTTWVTKRNDLLPVISGTILNADGTPVDLTGSTLTFLMRESQYPHNLKVNAAATITSALAGTWSYTWVAGDTNTAGLFQAELEATFPSGKPETFPSRGYIMVLVDEDVDITDVPDAELVTITDLVNDLRFAAPILAHSYATSGAGTTGSPWIMDTAAMTALTAAVPTGGGTVLFKKGSYRCAPFNIPASTTVTGEGDSTVLTLAAATNTNFLTTTAADVTITDLRIDGNRANQTSNSSCVYTVGARTRVRDCHVVDANGYNIVGASGATDMSVTGCVSEGARDECIEFQGVVRGLIANNICRNAGKNAIYIWGNTAGGGVCTDVTVTGNVVYNSAALTASFAGIRVDDGATNVTVVGNTVTGGGTTATGISVHTSTATLVSNVAVVGNTVSGSTLHGISIQSARDTAVSANVIRAAAQCGIFVDSNATGTTISGNTITNCQRSGIMGFNAVDFIVTGNVCRNNGQDQAQTNYYNGITLWNSSGSVDRGIVANNRCYDDQSTKTQQYGIRTLNTIGANVAIGPNVLAGNGTVGQLFSFGGATAPTSVPWKKLTGISVGSAGTSVPHGLPYIPTTFLIQMTSAGTIWKAGGSDATNIVLMSDTGTRTCDVYVG